MLRQDVEKAIQSIASRIQGDCFLRVCPRGRSLLIIYATSTTWVNNIIENDHGYTHLWMHDIWNADGEQIRPFTLESSLFGYHNYKIGYRNNCGFKNIRRGVEWQVIEKALTDYFTKMKEEIRIAKLLNLPESNQQRGETL